MNYFLTILNFLILSFSLNSNAMIPKKQLTSRAKKQKKQDKELNGPTPVITMKFKNNNNNYKGAHLNNSPNNFNPVNINYSEVSKKQASSSAQSTQQSVSGDLLSGAAAGAGMACCCAAIFETCKKGVS